MTAELRDQYDGFLISTLTLRVGSGRDCFAALNQDQRRVVREFLLFLKDDPDYRFSKHEMERSLTEFWSEQE
ncbi:MAG: hypothetical protein JWM59_4206 [Verrucomicrobiales bacterium]|nr:hypothetical protein [Verrucomicrobiales bacterium]